jgi:hypothetical protein
MTRACVQGWTDKTPLNLILYGSRTRAHYGLQKLPQTDGYMARARFKASEYSACRQVRVSITNAMSRSAVRHWR